MLRPHLLRNASETFLSRRPQMLASTVLLLVLLASLSTIPRTPNHESSRSYMFLLLKNRSRLPILPPNLLVFVPLRHRPSDPLSYLLMPTILKLTIYPFCLPPPGNILLITVVLPLLFLMSLQPNGSRHRERSSPQFHQYRSPASGSPCLRAV